MMRGSAVKERTSKRLAEGVITHKNDSSGLWWALVIIGLWIFSFAAALRLPIGELSLQAVIGVVILRTFLHTGLFITAHDAMHRTVFPANHRINDWLGTAAVGLYAFMPYRELLIKHQLHHRFPATGKDPDYHDGEHSGFFQWYLKFMKDYMESRNTPFLIAGMAVVFGVCTWLMGVPLVNLALFWLLPLVLSSLQLFYFGTYLPHRQPDGGYRNRHRATSNRLSSFWSFVSCYHFGYHWEHHEYPLVPWHRLPEARR
ncbi:beta-carotene ketolase CrtW [Gloeobacter violaceus]|uniref:Beta-carotene ketolase n=1 Tax=Gloeobacter violaceus (strain ATCC 29082 / PCC 7421) TaxID=251221 RepID=Q7NJV4_GLOVI|nr:beta-carotene ketolase [Gloeobacter violaceus PCC 7421]